MKYLRFLRNLKAKGFFLQKIFSHKGAKPRSGKMQSIFP